MGIVMFKVLHQTTLESCFGLLSTRVVEITSPMVLVLSFPVRIV